MDALSRRTLLAAGAATAATLAAGCAEHGTGNGDPAGAPPVRASQSAATHADTPQPPATLIGDGSTSDTGPQPHQPETDQLEPGQTPPQFVVFSWDGAGELDNQLFSRFRKLAQDHDAKMTFFLSGIYALPESKKDLYHPPQHPVGASDIGYLSNEHVRATLQQVGDAWLEGHEIGTHFNGHFCGPTGGGRWSPRTGTARSSRRWTSS
ncbi:hypothetical protein GCM10025734_34630 [Kitasatospora paranensis]